MRTNSNEVPLPPLSPAHLQKLSKTTEATASVAMVMMLTDLLTNHSDPTVVQVSKQIKELCVAEWAKDKLTANAWEPTQADEYSLRLPNDDVSAGIGRNDLNEVTIDHDGIAAFHVKVKRETAYQDNETAGLKKGDVFWTAELGAPGVGLSQTFMQVGEKKCSNTGRRHESNTSAIVKAGDVINLGKHIRITLLEPASETDVDKELNSLID